MPGNRIETEALDFLIGHAGKEIPFGIVLAQVCAAEPMALLQIVPAFGDVALRRLAAARRSTGPGFAGRRFYTRRSDADVVAEARAVSGRTHGIIMGWEA